MREYARPSGFVFLPMLRMCTVCVSFRFDGLFIIENTRILYFLISQILFSAEFTTEKKHSNSVFFFGQKILKICLLVLFRVCINSYL